MKIYRVAKHASDHSHSCVYCKDFLKPMSFSRNPKHHFPWGIVYGCSCGKSGLWTNSIRGEQEFMDVVFNNAEVKNIGSEKGFCNDLFCPICFSWLNVLKNSLGIDISGKMTAYVGKEKREYPISDYDKYIYLYNKNPKSVDKFNAECMEKPKYPLHVTKYIDVSGCVSLKHNLGVIRHGYASEYGEAEYKPIYDWIKANASRIPAEMISEFKTDISSQ